MSFPSPTKVYHTQPYPAISPTRPELSTAGKVILITGGGSGLGPHLALAFASSGSRKIALLGRTLSTLETSKASLEAQYPGIQVLVLVADITSATSTESAFSQAAQNFGPIDIFVSNAGYLPTVQKIATADPTEWVKGYSANVLGAFNLLQAFAQHKAEHAVILNVSTVAVHIPPVPSMSGYSTSKVAALQLFSYYQAENPDVRVMNFHPGVLETDMTVKTAEVFKVPFDDISLPAHLAVWLASEEAAFLKNRFIWSNWDVQELLAMKAEIEESSRFTMGLIGWPQ